MKTHEHESQRQIEQHEQLDAIRHAIATLRKGLDSDVIGPPSERIGAPIIDCFLCELASAICRTEMDAIPRDMLDGLCLMLAEVVRGTIKIDRAHRRAGLFLCKCCEEYLEEMMT